ncbi:MAG: MBL fold metallo-hydrolase, partial [Deltaproteobacteria bacterium]|nr:MBL fold metallo-hydrolase [Deltaproteobacteria bacterium]
MKRLFLMPVFLLAACGPPFDIDRPPPWQEPPAVVENLEEAWAKIIVLDVGQGDAALLIAPSGEALLIDTGPPERGEAAVLAVLSEQSVEQIPYLFISHHHEDHDGSLSALLDNPLFDTAQVIDPENAEVGATLRLGPLSIQILGANGQIGGEIFLNEEQRGDENALSVALMIEYGAFRYLTSGDLTGGGGDPPYETVDLESPLADLAGDVDILHVNHHGSHTSTNQNFLDGVTPEAALISVG